MTQAISSTRILIPSEGTHIVAYLVPEGVFDSCLSEYSGSGDFFGMFSDQVLSTHEICSGVDPTKKNYSVVVQNGGTEEVHPIEFGPPSGPAHNKVLAVSGLTKAAKAGDDSNYQEITIPKETVLFVIKRVYEEGFLSGDLGDLNNDKFDHSRLTIFADGIPACFSEAFQENDLLSESDGHVISETVWEYSYRDISGRFSVNYSNFDESYSAYHRQGADSWELDHMVEHSIA